MHVDEAGSEDAAVGVDDPRRVTVDRADVTDVADGNDPVTRDRDVGPHGRRTRAVDDQPAADHEVECCRHMAE